MLHWAAVFFVLAIVAGAVGFGGIAAPVIGAARLHFFIFVALFVLSLLASLFDRSHHTDSM